MIQIATIYTPYAQKFGVPRQPSLAPDVKGSVVFEKAYRQIEAVRGLEGFDRIWLLWSFSLNRDVGYQPTVRPPRLGGNERMGVFATRSPYRPNGIGLSCVKLEGIEHTVTNGPVLHVSGVDMVNGTPILDIKPYIPYSDAYPDAQVGFTSRKEWNALEVDVETYPDAWNAVAEVHRKGLLQVLAADPRPAYQHDAQRVYRFEYGGMEVAFSVDGNRLTLLSVRKNTVENGLPIL